MLPDAWRHWTAVAGLDEFTPGEELWLDTYEATVQAAAEGLGVALAMFPPERVLVDAGRLVVPFDCRIPSPQALYLVCREDERQRPQIEEFRRWLLEQIA